MYYTLRYFLSFFYHDIIYTNKASAKVPGFYTDAFLDKPKSISPIIFKHIDIAFRDQTLYMLYLFST